MKSFRTFIGLMLIIAASVAVGYGLSGLSEQAPSGSSSRSTDASASTLPKDVYPDSRNRLPLLKREELDEQGKKVYDMMRMQERPSAPTGIRLYSPPVAEYMTMQNQYLRNRSGLDPRMVELAILAATREIDAQYEWTSHEPSGLKAGLDRKIIDIVKNRKPLTGLGEKEAVIIQLGREAVGKHKVRSDTFARALKLFGKQGLVNVVSVMGDYVATAVLLTTFDQQLRPADKPLLPIP